MNDGNGQLKSYIDRLVSLAEAKRDNAEDTGEVLKEAKSNGFDPTALRAIVKLQMEDDSKRAKRVERETNLETYMAALGLLSKTPLGEAALKRAGLAA